MKKENIITIPDPMIMGQYKDLDFNEFIFYYVGTKNIHDSNSFLNSLWRNFNESLSPKGLEHCPWYHIPQKIMIKQLNITYFGSIRTQVGYFHIAVSYSKKGCIK